MRQLMLIRHGLTAWNVTGQFQGHSDIPLSPDGRVQGAALAAHLHHTGFTPDLVYSSPLARAVETAQLVFPDATIHQDARLKELNFGSFEGYTQLQNEQHDAWNEWFADPFKRCAPGGESYEELRLRAVDWLETLPDHASIAAVTHSGTIQMLVSHVLGVERPMWRKRIFLRHTGLTRFLFHNNEIVIERVNDARHLDDYANPFD